MHPLEGVARLAEWAGRDFAYNLSFIPEDRLNWKPEPTAKSALEVTHEATCFARAVAGYLRHGEFQWPSDAPATTCAEAQDRLTTATAEYTAALRDVRPEDLGRKISLPFGEFSLSFAASLPLVELIHHRGQVIYIQSLLGDTEAHFAPLE